MTRKAPQYTSWHQGTLRERALEHGYWLRRQESGLWSILHADSGELAGFGSALTLDEVADIVLVKMRK
jgi:hypothetical protein